MNLTEHLAEAFGTTDFGLAAYLMVTNKAELASITPLPRASNTRPLQFTFSLIPANKSTVDTLREAETDYINQKTQVEPIAYYAMRRRLHEQLTRLINNI